MVLAAKVRHKLLFTESLIFVAGSLEGGQVPGFEKVADIKIKTAA